MSSLAFLVTELQSLASETRRKHPEVREAAEKSLAILRASPEQATIHLATDGPQSEDLLRPVFMGCATRNAKVVAISLGSLQRLIAMKAVPLSAVPLIISTMNDSVSQGVDIQLRILQTLLSLITNFPAVHGALLGDALLLCFKLQESRIAVVSSTAAATLRQLVMFVVDKVVDEDTAEPSDQVLTTTVLPNGSSADLKPSARDAFSVFEDLCLLANSERPKFLRLESLHKTFALELIESVLTNYHDLFRKHLELLLLLQHHLCPLLLKSLSERPVFPLTLRSTRVVFLLLKQFSNELPTEAEVFLMLLIKVISGENDGDSASSHAPRPPWMRVIALEIIRGLCSDGDLMRGVWQRYDSQRAGSNVFAALITALKRLATEKPALLGVGTQIMGVGISPSYSAEGSSGYGIDVGSVAGMVANAASATMSGVVGMMGAEASLSVNGSSMKLQCIDQLDKADSPPIPESYIFLLALQCLVSLVEGFASLVLPLYNSLAIVRPRAAGETIIRAPPALDLAGLPLDDTGNIQLRIVHEMLENGWPALLAALSFFISTNLSDELFADVLGALQSLINVSGVLGLTTPRDAFLTSVSKLAVPSRVVSSLDSFQEPPTPKSAVLSVENLGLGGLAGGQSPQPGLSDRNLACLKALISSALFLAGSLGPSWFDVLEALQNADYVLTKGITYSNKRPQGPPPSSSSTLGNASQSAPLRHPALVDLDAGTIQHAIQRLFDSTKNLEDDSFHDFVAALCRLSAEMVGMQAVAEQDQLDVEPAEDTSGPKLSARAAYAHRRRASGIALPRTMRTGDFGINKLGAVSLLNIHRLIYRDADIAWNSFTTHLLAVIRHPQAPPPIRLQAARILDEILVIVPRNLSAAGDLQGQIQARVLSVLSQQVSVGTMVDIRRMGLETLHQILQSSAHTFVTGWESIFDMLGSVCKPSTLPASKSLPSESDLSITSELSTPRRPTPLQQVGDKNNVVLIRIAFQSLTLVCDTLSSLSPEHLRLCIKTLGLFGKQTDTNIALTAAESLMWSVSDSIQSKRKDTEKETEFSALWMFLLLELLGLCTDARHEVRVGAIQTLFRSLQLYGATLSLETWDECIWKIIFPLLDSITASIRQSVASPPAVDTITAMPGSGQSWDESKCLALQSLSSIFSDFLTLKVIRLLSFKETWHNFVSHVEGSFLFDNRNVSTAALRCLERALDALKVPANDAFLLTAVLEASERVWQACDEMGTKLSKSTAAATLSSPRSESNLEKFGMGIIPFSQDSLLAFMDVIKKTREVSKIAMRCQHGDAGESEWSLERLARLMAILKGIVTYSNSPEYRPDIDTLTPVQAALISTVSMISLSIPSSPSLILSDLSSYATLPFLAAFDVGEPLTNSPSRRAPKRVTYIALAKKTMPMLVDLYLKYKDSREIYANGTLEAILSAYSIPIKLKYDCPSPSKFGNDPPLWKTATECFLRIVKECSGRIQRFGDDISDERVEGIWHQILDVFRGGLLADCSAAISLPLAEQEAEENFDLALLATLEIDVVPPLGADLRIPDRLVVGLAKSLGRASSITDDIRSSSHDLDYRNEGVNPHMVEGNGHAQGTTQQSSLVPRERFSYWCFDLLFLICSDVAKDQEPARRRVASLCLPALLARCGGVLVHYVADCKLRGNVPFPRFVEEELLYVLRKLVETRLWPGTLWAAFQTRPSEIAVVQPPLDPALSPSQLIPLAIQRSPVAHLFHFYSLLCEIAALPTKPPSAFVMPSVNAIEETATVQEQEAKNIPDDRPSPTRRPSIGITLMGKFEPVEVDSRQLSRGCLMLIGKELAGQGQV
ncbi:hypothetical protein K439DRAFT_1394877 [Ramaria rubella]|nr:hypothetical protein K439DRAFT_1394877 [Ramaria rubella]